MADILRYCYDRVTGAFTGTTVAPESPLEPGVILEPAFSTPIAPPQAPAQQAPIWSRTMWKLAPDHRGETWYQGREPVLIVDVGDPAVQGLAPDQAPLPPLLPPTSCTKLGLKRAFGELGLWELVKGFIAADPDRQEEWDLATELRLTDPIMVSAIQAFALQGITIDPVKLATRANELVA